MNRNAPWMAGMAIALFVCATQASDMTAASTKNVMRVYTDSVAPADQAAYEAGHKAFNKCLGEHGVQFGWTAWLHDTGDIDTYSYTSDPMTWADFDTMEKQSKACYAVLRTQASPYLKSASSAFLVQRPDLSRPGADMDKPGALMTVVSFTLKPGHKNYVAFQDAVKKIQAAETKAKWPYYSRFAEVRYGGQGASSYIVYYYSKNWADAGAETKPSMWKVVENAYGKTGSEAIRARLDDALQSSEVHIDTYSADMSYIPAGR